MATKQLQSVVQCLRTATLLHDAGGASDAQLLESFVARKDGAAFSALVQRHGPMVWGVCRRVLGHVHDAEDAFQATFLVLVRKAASVVPRAMVGNWLHGVALRMAWKARAVSNQRRTKERQVTGMREPELPQQDLWRDLQPLLDQEMDRLPHKYRVAIVLCDLEGKTHQEAARQLGWPVGTLSTRLVRGRALLAKRLSGRGVTLSAGALAGMLSHNAASASVPPVVLCSAIKAATSLAAGHAATTLVSTRVAALTEGMLKTMLLTKLSKAVAVVFLLTVVGTGLGLVNYNLQAADRVEIKKVAKEPGAAPSDALAGLRQARVTAARKAFDKVWSQYRAGWHDEEQVYRWSVRLLEAERAATVKTAEAAAALQGHLRRMKDLEQTAPDRPIIGSPASAAPVRLGEAKGQARWVHITDGNKGANMVMAVEDIPRSDIAALTAFYRAEAEVWLGELRAGRH
jgi:RNA polymerase sigma factor (sigma-70 family)